MMQGDVILGVPLAFTILAVIATLLRVCVRARMKTGLGWDDWTMLLAAVSISEICRDNQELCLFVHRRSSRLSIEP